MKQNSEFSSEHQHQHVSENRSQQQAVREFANTEELLRFDASQTPVPPGIGQRLEKSARDIPRPNRPWWKRLFNS